MPATVEVYRSASLRRSQRWRWRLIASTGDVVAVSSEGYANFEEADDMARRVVGGTYSAALVVTVDRRGRS